MKKLSNFKFYIYHFYPNQINKSVSLSKLYKYLYFMSQTNHKCCSQIL